jgi:hypothetical protein
MSGAISRQVTGTVGNVVDGVPVNAIVALLLAGYLIACIVQANVTGLGTQLRADLFGDSSHKPFWRWALAFTLLAWLAGIPSLSKFFGPMFLLSLLAMLITQAEKGQLATLNSSLRQLFGYGSTSSTSSTSSTTS